PKGVFCHGYLTVKGQKISKLIPATRVDPNAIVAELGYGFVDPLRYFVLREYTLGGDGDFTYEALFQRHESDLGNDLGNLLNRTVATAHKFVRATLPARQERDGAGEAALGEIQRFWEDFSPSQALEATWGIIRGHNQLI